jgi:1-acyl-sn-glycerol-3-phosphate acyltransferase
VRPSRGGQLLERLAGGATGAPRAPRRWRTVRAGPDPWAEAGAVGDQAWLRERWPSLVREGLQQTLLFPACRVVARPRVEGADDLVHAPQPAVIAPNHASDIDTPLVLAALPRAWRSRTLVGAASDRFYRKRSYALMSGIWINTFPFDRGAELRGLGDAAGLLRAGYNVLLYPQGTRSAGEIDGFRTGVARLSLAAGVPLLPVYVGGTATIMPKGRGLIQRGSALVRFGRPLYPEAGEDPVQLMERARDAVVALERGRPAYRESGS